MLNVHSCHNEPSEFLHTLRSSSTVIRTIFLRALDHDRCFDMCTFFAFTALTSVDDDSWDNKRTKFARPVTVPLHLRYNLRICFAAEMLSLSSSNNFKDSSIPSPCACL